MSCTGCYNGCIDITSDQCVKYTGSAIAALEIDNGDPLSTVIAQISAYLTSVMTGEGVIPVIDNADLCALVSGYLPIAGDITLNDVISALIQAACDLQSQVDDVVADVAVIEANYTVGCLSGVSAGSGTHAILQAVIVKLCQAVLDITALQTALSAYVPIADIDQYIEDYLTSQVSTKHYLKMVPYTAVEFYGDPAGKFDITGAGIGDWEQIYLCNGQNGTPDKRGRLPVGTTSMGNTAFNVAVDPAIAGNPTYDLLDLEGANKVAINVSQIPLHSHTATSTVNDPGHRHVFASDPQIADATYTRYGTLPTGSDSSAAGAEYYTKSELGVNNKASQLSNVTVSTSLTSTGGSQSHSNIPPVMACHYIIYLPTV